MVVSTEDDAQLVVVAALVVAVVFVGLALVLNSAIYAENTATRDTTSENREILEQREGAENHLAEAIDRTNARIATDDPDTLETELSAAVENRSAIRTRDEAQDGVRIHVDSFDPREGVRLRQTNETRNFTPRDGSTDAWTLADGVPDGGQFAMNIRSDSVFVATYDTTMALVADSAFSIEFLVDEDDADAAGYDTSREFNDPIAYRVYVFEGSITGGIYAITEMPDQEFRDDSLSDRAIPEHIVAGWLNQSCSLEGEVITIRLNEGTFGGSHCPAFDFYDELDAVDAHEVRFNNTVDDNDVNRAEGTYGILLNTTEPATGKFHDATDAGPDNQPFRQSAVYSLDYTYSYRTTSDVYEESTATVVPKEKDPGGILWEHPRIERFDVVDRSDEEAGNGFRVDWRVWHAQGELDRVDLELIDRTVEAREDEVRERLNETLTADPYEEYLGESDLCDDLFGWLSDCDGSTVQDEIRDNESFVDDYYDDLNSTLEDVEHVDQPLNTNTVVDDDETSVDGVEAAGTNDLVDDDPLGTGEAYRVKLVVTDASGRSTGIVMECTAGAEPTDCERVATTGAT